MPQIPEELVQALMKLTGQNRKSVEQMLQSSVQEMIGRQSAQSCGGGASKSGRASEGNDSPAYTCEEYPHYRPAERVQKYTLRITLRHLRPAIWRKVDVPSNISLRHLGDLILDLMGWGGWHLNQFIKGDSYYMPCYQREASGESDFSWDCENLNQEDYSIGDLLSVKGRYVVFEYDFGDSWEHEVRLSGVSEYQDDEVREIVFRGGERCCPPDDCGSVWGYEELLGILAKRKAGKRLSADERDQLEWAGWGKNYDPEALDLDECRRVVARFNS